MFFSTSLTETSSGSGNRGRHRSQSALRRRSRSSPRCATACRGYRSKCRLRSGIRSPARPGRFPNQESSVSLEQRYDLHLKMENQELKIRIYHPEEEAFGNSDVRINHCAPAGRSSRRTPSCGPLRAEAPARAAPRCRRALEYLSHRLFCCPSIGQLAAGGRCFPSRRDEVQPSAPGGCGLPLFDQWNE